MQKFWENRAGKGSLSRFWLGLRGAGAPRMRALYITSLGLGLLLAFGITAVQGQLAFANTCAELRADTLRLHIVANSNSAADQSAKLAVRDAILAVMDEVYQEALQNAAEDVSGETSAQDAPAENTETLTLAQSTALVLANMPRFALAASEALAACDIFTQSGTLAGGTQQINLSLTTEYFGTTVYDTFTLPAGYYTALRVEIGAAAGQNWWCVLSPALCLASAVGTYDTAAENEIICGDYALRFAAIEWWQNCVNGCS